MSSSTTLRAITLRLTTTPVTELPYVASYLATSLGSCGEITAHHETKKTRTDVNDALQINKLKARLTSLLQDRSFEGRWTAVVLIKAILEAGRWEVLRDCGPWVSGLLGILSKQDPPSTKKLSIITLTRIFQLTYQYPTLVREITTPNLPGFITISLNLINAKNASGSSGIFKEAPLLQTVLSAFSELIGRHPTIFRPFVGQLQKLLLSILAFSTTSGSLSSRTIQLAQELFVALHHCAPRNTSAEQWATDCKNTIASAHQCADHLFRSLNEQWESSDPNFKHKRKPKDLSESPQDNEPDALGLSPWQSLSAGAVRLTTLLGLLAKFISVRTASTINYPLGAILDVTSRLTSITVPRTKEDNAQSNSEFSRDERAALYIELPRIHTACIDLLHTIVATFGTGSMSVVNAIFEQNLWVFEAESFNSSIRESSYRLTSEILPLIGRSFVKENVLALSPLIRQCCSDLVPADTNHEVQEQKNGSKGNYKNTQINVNVDALLNPALKESSSGKEAAIRELELMAMALLPLLYNYLPSEFIPLPVRTEMERVAILTANRSAMVASVMNPMPPIKGRRPIPSILPFLTRKYSKDMEVECLVRPRMPVILGNTSDYIDAEDYEENEEPGQDEVLAAPSTQDMYLNPVHDRQLKDAALVSSLTAQNKRELPVDSKDVDQKISIPSQNSEQIFPQSKKARLEDDETPAITTTTVAITPSEVTPSSHVISSAPSPLDSSVTGSNAPTFTSVGENIQTHDAQKFTNNTVDAHDSDDEMPSLNIEPDTDEEEDE